MWTKSLSWPSFTDIHSPAGREACWQVHVVILSLKPPCHQGDTVLENTAGQIPVYLSVTCVSNKDAI